MSVDSGARLAALERLVLDAGAVVSSALAGAVRLLEGWDDRTAEEILRADELVQERCAKVERDAEYVFALRAPVAGDLRLVLGLLHVTLHLGRMGRNCVRIEQFAERVIADVADAALLARFADMGWRAEHSVRTAFEALAERDVEKAVDVGRMDGAIDADNLWVMDHALALGSDPVRRAWAMHSIFVARSLERMGDHASAVAAQTIYIVTGEQPRPSLASVRHG